MHEIAPDDAPGGDGLSAPCNLEWPRPREVELPERLVPIKLTLFAVTGTSSRPSTLASAWLLNFMATSVAAGGGARNRARRDLDIADSATRVREMIVLMKRETVVNRPAQDARPGC